MDRIRVLLPQKAKSPLLREILQKALKQSLDMEIVCVEDTSDYLQTDASFEQVDVVILDLGEQVFPETFHQTSAVPRPIVVSLVNDGRQIIVDASRIGVDAFLDLIRFAVGKQGANVPCV